MNRAKLGTNAAIPRTRVHQAQIVVCSIGASALISLVGCASVPVGGAARASFDDWRSRDRTSQDWAGNYEQTERRAEKTGQPMAFCFTDTTFTVQDATLSALRDERVASRLKDFARGTLVRSFEPDRRYAEQFGVTRAPSLILVHRDGTCHTYTGLMKPDALVAFLDAAQPPGAPVVRNPLVPRSFQYHWIDDLDEGTKRAQAQSVSMIVVYARHLSGDWKKLSPMLASREVGLRIADFVHCRVRLLPQTGEAFITPFGALRLPAVVIVTPDGNFATVERPDTPGMIARSVDQHLQTAVVESPSNVSGTGVEQHLSIGD